MKLTRNFYHYWIPILLVLTEISLSSSSQPQGDTLPYMTSDIKEVSGKSFDYIIVGGGTAGCPLAATLSEKFKVLIIERGDSPYGNPVIEKLKFYGFQLLQTDAFSSPVQEFTSKDGVKNMRGRILGGGSSINLAFYSRASRDSVYRAGWDTDLVEDAYKWVESKLVFKPELTKWQSALKNGFLEAGIQPYNGYSLEHLSGTKIGSTIYDRFGNKHTSADLLKAGNPDNIIVLLNSTVKSLIFDDPAGNENESKIVRGIRFIKSNGDPEKIYEAYINRPESSNMAGDVILSAGAIGSPQILLLSGIGPPKHLHKFNIPLNMNLKGVGKDMQDNPGIAVIVVNETRNRRPEPPQVAAIAENSKFIIESGIIPINLTTTRIRISAKIAFPTSKGQLKLNNTDPRQNPLVKFNYLVQEKDLKQCKNMVSLLQHVARTKAISYFLKSKHQEKLIKSDYELMKYCKQNVRTFYHYHGGCVVGSVVDRDYRVYGIKGLRVVDGSTFSESPGTNPMATLLMLGRYQGIKILKERK